MIIIFLDQLGCYAAVLAASRRAGLVGDRPTIRDICSLPKFADHPDLSVGNLYFIGEDPAGARVYTLGAGKEAGLIAVAAGDLIKILKTTEKVSLIDVSRYNDFLTRISWRAMRIKLIKPAALYIAAFQMKKKMGRLAETATRELNGSPG